LVKRKELQIVKTRIAILLGTLVLVAGGVVLAAAQGMHEPGPPSRNGMPPPPMGAPDIERLSQALGLTDAQTTELKPFLDTEHATIEGLRKTLDDAHQQMETATANGQFDEAQVRKLAGQQAQAMTELIVEQERVKAKIYNVLTPDQRAKAAQFHRHGPGGPRGPGGPMPPPATDNN
jgi:Spy/CpxP family protein refolding chaperone